MPHALAFFVGMASTLTAWTLARARQGRAAQAGFFVLLVVIFLALAVPYLQDFSPGLTDFPALIAGLAAGTAVSYWREKSQR